MFYDGSTSLSIIGSLGLSAETSIGTVVSPIRVSIGTGYVSLMQNENTTNKPNAYIESTSDLEITAIGSLRDAILSSTGGNLVLSDNYTTSAIPYFYGNLTLRGNSIKQKFREQSKSLEQR